MIEARNENLGWLWKPVFVGVLTVNLFSAAFAAAQYRDGYTREEIKQYISENLPPYMRVLAPLSQFGVDMVYDYKTSKE